MVFIQNQNRLITKSEKFMIKFGRLQEITDYKI